MDADLEHEGAERDDPRLLVAAVETFRTPPGVGASVKIQVPALLRR